MLALMLDPVDELIGGGGRAPEMSHRPAEGSEPIATGRGSDESRSDKQGVAWAGWDTLNAGDGEAR